MKFYAQCPFCELTRPFEVTYADPQTECPKCDYDICFCLGCNQEIWDRLVDENEQLLEEENPDNPEGIIKFY